MNLSNLTILDRNRQVVQTGTTPVTQTPGVQPMPLSNSSENPLLDTNLNIQKLEKLNSQLRTGKISTQASKKVIMRTNPKMLEKLENTSRHEATKLLIENLRWFIQIKKLIIGWNPIAEKYKKLNLDNLLLDPNLISENAETRANQILSNSFLLKETLTVLIEDPKHKPQYGPSEYFLNFLIENNSYSQFVKELQLLLEFKQKYFVKFSEKFAETINNGITSGNLTEVFKTMDNIDYFQPRYKLINNHVLNFKNASENLHTSISNTITEIDDTEVNDKKLKSVDYKIHALGLYKRINNFCSWLDNGIIQTQYTLNRLNSLKIRRTDDFQNINYEKQAETNFDVWAIIRDNEAFMKSLQENLNGDALVVGITTTDMLKVLNVSL